MAAWFKRSTATSLPSRVFDCQSGSWRNLFPTKKTDYRADCDGCGTKTIDLGVHNICTLNVVMNARGANSGCFLQRLGPWSLSSIDPAPPDSANIERASFRERVGQSV